MVTTSNGRTVMSTRPLKRAFVYDFYLFVQLFVFVLLTYTVGRVVYALDRLAPKPVVTPLIIKSLESVASVAVIKK
jgi:hypothetical protein